MCPYNMCPFKVFNFINWSHCRLSDYGLKDLPADILKHMKSIKTLDFSRNNLTTFPEVTLKTLETLDISENNIDSIDFVKNLPNLKQLMVEGNPNIQVKLAMFCQCPKQKWGKNSYSCLLPNGCLIITGKFAFIRLFIGHNSHA